LSAPFNKMSRPYSLVEQLGALSWPQLCERSRAVHGPKAGRLPASAQRSALAEHYDAHPRLHRLCRAPKMVKSEYDEILEILESLPWEKILRRNAPKSRKSAKATRESFVMGGVLGQRGFHGFRGATVGKMGYNDTIVPMFLQSTARTP